MRLVRRQNYHAEDVITVESMARDTFTVPPGPNVFSPLHKALQEIALPAPLAIEIFMTIVPYPAGSDPRENYGIERRFGQLWLCRAETNVIVPIIAVDLKPLLQVWHRYGLDAVTKELRDALAKNIPGVIETIGKARAANGNSSTRTQDQLDALYTYVSLEESGGRILE